MSAILSECGAYRYRLERGAAGITVAYLGVNPSTADHNTDDATVRKWRGFAAGMGASRLIVGNLFAYRATDVRELGRQVDPVGPLNDAHLVDIVLDADIIVACWGSRNKIPPRLRPRLTHVTGLLKKIDRPVYAFGFTADGDPKHPLFLPYSSELVRML